MNTLDPIHDLAKERFNLWRKAGNGGLSAQETQQVQAITAKLADLWDTHRRDVASGSRRQQTEWRAA